MKCEICGIASDAPVCHLCEAMILAGAPVLFDTESGFKMPDPKPFDFAKVSRSIRKGIDR